MPSAWASVPWEKMEQGLGTAPSWLFSYGFNAFALILWIFAEKKSSQSMPIARVCQNFILPWYINVNLFKNIWGLTSHGNSLVTEMLLWSCFSGPSLCNPGHAEGWFRHAIQCWQHNPSHSRLAGGREWSLSVLPSALACMARRHSLNPRWINWLN